MSAARKTIAASLANCSALHATAARAVALPCALLCLFASWLPAVPLSWQTTAVSNVHVEGVSGQYVSITYDLHETATNVCMVWVKLSDDGGGTWSAWIPSRDKVAGDTGTNVAPGLARRILWNAADDLGTNALTNVTIAVCADNPIPPRPDMVWLDGQDGFLMGQTNVPLAEPVHFVRLSPFWISRYECTAHEYLEYLNSAASNGLVSREETDARGNLLYTLNDPRSPITKSGGAYVLVDDAKSNHPVVNVTWNGAVAFARYYGLTLPTEAQWEFAARGGMEQWLYPWGNEITGTNANYRNSGDPWDNGTTPVGYYPANGYGLYDVVGNVTEWSMDALLMDRYQYSRVCNPVFQSNVFGRVTCSSSWRYSLGYAEFLATAFHSGYWTNWGADDRGLRVSCDERGAGMNLAFRSTVTLMVTRVSCVVKPTRNYRDTLVIKGTASSPYAGFCTSGYDRIWMTVNDVIVLDDARPEKALLKPYGKAVFKDYTTPSHRKLIVKWKAGGQPAQWKLKATRMWFYEAFGLTNAAGVLPVSVQWRCDVTRRIPMPRWQPVPRMDMAYQGDTGETTLSAQVRHAMNRMRITMRQERSGKRQSSEWGGR